MRDDAIYLGHVLESIDLIQRYLTDAGGILSAELFYDDVRTQDAVLRRMETLTDSASRLSDELKARHPEIPWRAIRDFRNVLAHGYTEVRLDPVWNAVVGDLPALRRIASEELRGLRSE